MTGRLHVRFDKELMFDSVDHSVLATIKAIVPVGDPGPVEKSGRDVLLPSGTAERLQVDLDAGRYVVEAVLPSGDIVSDQVEVVNDADVELDLRGESSPREWLSWHQFMGNVEQTEQSPEEAGLGEAFRPAVYWVMDPVAPLRGDGPSGGDGWTLLTSLADLPGEGVASRLAEGTPQQISPFEDDTNVAAQLYQVVAEGPWTEWHLPADYGPPPTPRRYVVAETGGATRVVCIPAPWVNLKTAYQVPVQILVRKKAMDPEVAVTIRDPLIGSALGYMTLGALHTADRLFGHARQLLFQKFMNPLGAAGGGYVLLATEHGSDPKEWHSWIANLMNYFEWLPDGAIQHAWLKLRHRGSAADVDEAREALFTAYRRGLPFYSVGLEWLIDGLTMFAPKDPAAAQMLLNVRQVAWMTNMQEPFTIIRTRRA